MLWVGSAISNLAVFVLVVTKSGDYNGCCEELDEEEIKLTTLCYPSNLGYDQVPWCPSAHFPELRSKESAGGGTKR